ncbi:uncharacterized protein zgc:193726 [Ctenopharyngodon idella]|uniref:uncharacterized protein zgc:193726 n=1 Tax=Ctenopharyngodon idella TaxID=7959 RepID=UPI0022320246|nr:uncharacterized protein zgc:193726 [Ctenopharyngodon idella]
MNSMFPVWTLSSLILSYTLGFPIFNNSGRGSYMETFPNLTDSMEHKTRLMENNATSSPETHDIFCCHLDVATCTLSNLGSSLQIGDGIAGDLARNPMGIGKK